MYFVSCFCFFLRRKALDRGGNRLSNQGKLRFWTLLFGAFRMVGPSSCDRKGQIGRIVPSPTNQRIQGIVPLAKKIHEPWCWNAREYWHSDTFCHFSKLKKRKREGRHFRRWSRMTTKITRQAQMSERQWFINPRIYPSTDLYRTFVCRIFKFLKNSGGYRAKDPGDPLRPQSIQCICIKVGCLEYSCVTLVCVILIKKSKLQEAVISTLHKCCRSTSNNMSCVSTALFWLLVTSVCINCT